MARVARAGPLETESRSWHALPAAETVRRLASDAGQGLSAVEARERLHRYGPNELPRAARASVPRLILDQFADFLVIVLLVAIAVSLVAGEWVDAGAISAILLLNAALGFVQEYRAERALEALERLSAPVARVVRGGELRSIEASALVPGDIIQLLAGDIVPADGRLISGDLLQTQESALTGESVPVEKSPHAEVEAEAALGDRLNMVYAATVVTRGSGRAVMVATGANTEAGRLAALVQQSGRRPTPLQRRLGETGRRLILAALSLAVLLVVIGILRGEDTGQMLLAGIALAVAAVPEGLPAAVTIVLAFGVQRMVRRHALVRRLESVETLGTTTVICTDKTGTLTQNRLTAQEMLLEGERVTIALNGGEGAGGLFQAADPDRIAPALRWALTVAALCHDPSFGETRVRGQAIGDPAEVALLALATRAGFSGETLRKEYRPVTVLPFESGRKMMSALYSGAGGQYVLLAKGAPETIAQRSAALIRDGREDQMTAGDRQLIEERAAEMASRGLRVLGLAYREMPSPELTPETEGGLVFVGLIGLADPLRPEARDAVEASRRAGIRVLMLTGDHAQTGLAVARELGIAGGDGREAVVTGRQIDETSDRELEQIVRRVDVYARVSGEHKLRIVRALHRLGEIVAMTGDGVNDAPALKEADIGVAMGLSGTDVAREASDMVLTDDNFSSIVAAVEEGRTIYANIRRFVYFLLSCNLGEILVMLIAAAAAAEAALLPVQILWLNLVTDGLPALALGLEPARPERMREKPRPPGERMLGSRIAPLLGVQAALLAAPTLAAFAYGMESDGIQQARELAFMTLVAAHLFAAFNFRSTTQPLFRVGVWSNPILLVGVAAAFAVQLVPFYAPFLNDVFDVSPLSLTEWAIIVPLASVSFFGMEAFKLLRTPAAAGQPGAD